MPTSPLPACERLADWGPGHSAWAGLEPLPQAGASLGAGLEPGGWSRRLGDEAAGTLWLDALSLFIICC